MIDRRTILAAALAALTTPALTRTASAQAAMTKVTAYAFSFPALAGGDIGLADYAGRPLLIVNTASLCGFTPQYAGLQQLWTEFHDRGLMIVGVPSNDFGAQEPGGRHRDSADRAAPIWRDLSDYGKDGREGPGGAPILQMGRKCAAEGCSTVELPQISDWPRWLYRRGLP
jgi:Glutathione peroxidase